MLTIYIDADACPVKEETYRVARRYAMAVKVVANAPMRVPAEPLMELVVRTGFGAADDWIAEQAGPGDVVVTADIPLAARCLAKGARVLDPKGRVVSRSLTTTTTTLEKVDDDGVVLRIASTYDLGGKTITTPAQLIKQTFSGTPVGQALRVMARENRSKSRWRSRLICTHFCFST